MGITLDERYQPLDACFLEVRAGEGRAARVELERGESAAGVLQRYS
jgi:hypothetical protein